eukprot:2599398-Pyramimonas_sp.AAC.1
MLDNFTIFARGGIILFSWSAVTLKGSPIDSLISTVLLEERSGQQSYPYTSGSTKYTLKWTFNNDLGIVLVAVSYAVHSLHLRTAMCSVRVSHRSTVNSSDVELPARRTPLCAAF